ncbi:MarR family winged helix-turn-helix transcriptional regulator [Lacrimispora saccharolytica]|uniref:Transcriptional regulator, MarR family n=1 Tax=Lacrimispora saccharolytica (strain ATCC 35040 / DSM 2544 / NRCC 2533 / WM1) TaxID=610130 RepID=D9R7M9_LACSW|nr:MarR family transcriptional regulator [Lacrimispora saccharolytica]ADL03758.1 transcriptional regulator, MarR family [[Clostridium] saccharolyticum WM1]QRV18111.1 MarR family transcriptional regulator [Lacrimispora saccharolytica]
MEKNMRIGLVVRILANQIGREFDYQISKLPGDITGLQGRVISFVMDKSEDVFQRDIEKELDIRRSTATALLQLMEKKGLLTREAVSDDARLKKIVLTEKSLGIHNQIKNFLDQVERQLIKGLTDDEINTFFSVMKKISNNIK